MNLLAVFCYVTVTCDWGAGPTAAAAQGPPDADGRNPRVPAADGRKTVRQTSSYPTRYDYINVETVLSNERILKVLFNCVINRGPCTREGLELKRIIPDAIQTECAKCSEQQRRQAGKVLAHLLTYKPEYWKMLVQKFDPNNVYLRKYMTDDTEEEKAFVKRLTNESSTVKS